MGADRPQDPPEVQIPHIHFGSQLTHFEESTKTNHPLNRTLVRKHRNDVFHLAATLPGEPGPELPSTILDDLRTFLEAFPEDSKEWQGIRESLKDSMAGGISIAGLRSTIQRYYRL